MNLSNVLIALLWIVGLIPLSVRRDLGWWAGYLLAFFPGRERKVAELQIRAVLGISPLHLVRLVFANVGQNFLEATNLFPVLRSNHIKCEVWSEIRELTSRPAGVVVLSAHVGNWDLLAAYMVAHEVPLIVVGREARNPSIHSALDWLRKRYRISVMWRANRKGSNELQERLRQGYAVAALIDQDTVVRSEVVPFFGVSARTPSRLVEIAQQEGSAIVSVFLVRTSASRYEVRLRELDSALSTREILCAYHNHLEEIVREFPEQWVWFHKRWRTDAEGQRRSREEYLTHLESLGDQIVRKNVGQL